MSQQCRGYHGKTIRYATHSVMCSAHTLRTDNSSQKDVVLRQDKDIKSIQCALTNSDSLGSGVTIGDTVAPAISDTIGDLLLVDNTILLIVVVDVKTKTGRVNATVTPDK